MRLGRWLFEGSNYEFRLRFCDLNSKDFTCQNDPQEFLSCLHGTVTYAPDWDSPLGDDDWEACK